MKAEFDQYGDDYQEQVAGAISFIGQGHDYFLETKVRYHLKLMDRYVGPAADAVLLDFGCGKGMADRYFSGRVLTLHGVDVSEELLVRAREQVPEAHYTRYDGVTLPYADDSMDAVFASCVLHHVPPENWTGTAKEIRRVLRPGGIFAIFEHNPFNPLTRLAVFRCEFDADAVLLTRGRARRLLEEAGLTPVERRYIFFFPFRGAFWERVNRLLGALPLGAQYYAVGQKG